MKLYTTEEVRDEACILLWEQDINPLDTTREIWSAACAEARKILAVRNAPETQAETDRRNDEIDRVWSDLRDN